MQQPRHYTESGMDGRPTNRQTTSWQEQANQDASSNAFDLGWEIMLELVKHMKHPRDRSVWRLVNKAACQAVYEGTTALTRDSDAVMADITVLPLPLLAKCSGLKQLYCAGLQCLASIQGLPPGLRLLDISWTAVTDFSPLERCSGLTQLSVGNITPIYRAVAAQPLAAALGRLTRLQHLDLHNNSMGQCIPALALAIQGLTELQHLDLSWNKITAEGARALAPAFQQLARLQHLDLSRNKIGTEGAAALAPALQGLTQLQSLDLSWNHMSMAGAQAAAQQLTMLQELSIVGNNMDG